jgi:hypothetical protein
MVCDQEVICNPQANEETGSRRDEPKQDGEPKTDGILAPTYFDSVSIGELAEPQGFGSAPPAEASNSTNEQRGKTS